LLINIQTFVKVLDLAVKPINQNVKA